MAEKRTGIERGDRPDDAAAYLIQRSARLLRVLFQRAVGTSEPELTPEMWLILSRLVARDGQYQSELAEATLRDRPNVSRIVAGLERRGFVTRRKDNTDRRRQRVYLTARSRRCAATVAPVAARVRDSIYEGLSQADVAQLRRSLRRIEKNALAALRELPGQDSPLPGPRNPV